MPPKSITTVYSASELIVLFGTVDLMPGRNKDEFLRVEKIGDDDIESDVDVDGNVVFFTNKDARYNFYLTLRQESPTNQYLSALANTAKFSPGMVGGIQVFEVRDPNGKDVYFAANAVVCKSPDRTWGEKPGTNEWKFLCASLDRNDGGATPVAS